jgi:hypothetical protein
LLVTLLLVLLARPDHFPKNLYVGGKATPTARSARLAAGRGEELPPDLGRIG